MELHFLYLFLILLFGWLAGQVANALRYPAVLGELIVGILLGPPLLGFLVADEGILVLAEVGVLLMMLYVGMEIDIREMWKASWAGLLAAVGGFVAPFVLGYLVVVWMGYSVEAALFLGIAVAITSLTTKSRILVDLGILDTRIAHVLMAGALVSDSAALIAFAAVLGFVTGGTAGGESVLLVGVNAVLFFAVAAFLGFKVMPFLFRRLAKAGLGGRSLSATLVFLIAILFAELAELAGLHGILGAFVAGLFLGEDIGYGRKVSRELTSMVHDVSIGFLAPIFFVTAGFEVTFDVFRTDLPLLLAVFAVAFVGKILGTAVFYLPTGYGWREGITIGAGMNGRGAVEIIIAGIGLQYGIISSEIFSILVFMAIFTTATVPIGLKWGIEWLKRNDELVRARDERRGTLIVGAGPIARRLATLLSASQPVRLLDSNRNLCRTAERDGLRVHCGDALEEGVLEEAGALTAETVVGLTGNTEVNLLSAQLARNAYLVPSAYVLRSAGRNKDLDTLLEEIEARPLFPGTVDLAEWDRMIARGEVHEEEMGVPDGATAATLAESLQESGEAIPLIVKRGEQRLLFSAVDRFAVGDAVVTLRRVGSPAAEAEAPA